MDISVIQFLIVCPLVFLAGFVDAVAGGGGLISLPAYLIAGFPVHFAIGTNKLSSAMGTALTTVRYTKSGFIPWKQAIFCVVFALLGSACGANLALLIGDRILKIIMLVILPLTGAYVMRGKALSAQFEPYSKLKTTLLGCAIAFFIGAYDGFYGPGTGTFLILLLTALAHMPVTEANGVSKAINLATNISALVVFIINGKVIFAVGLVAGLFSIAGNWLGSSFFKKGGGIAVKPIMITVLVIFFIKVLYEVIGA